MRLSHSVLSVLGLLSLSVVATTFACSGGDPGSSGTAPDAAAGDAAVEGAVRAAAPSFDPTKGSFTTPREAVDALVVIATKAELTEPDRFFPMRDPLFIASAISEVRRAAATTECVNGQYGCPSSASATALVDEYVANKVALTSALKKVQAVQHAWGRIALAKVLLGALNLLEQAGALGTQELAALLVEANKLAAALASPTTTPSGIYPDLSENAALYRLAFQQIRPAPAPAPSYLIATNEFIDAVLGRLAIGPKPEDPSAIGPKPEDPSAIGPKPEDPFSIGPKPEDPLGLVAWRLKRGLSDQGIDFRGTIAEGGAAAQSFDALAYFIVVTKAADPSAVDGYIATIDALLPKVASGTAVDADWASYVGAADKLAGTFDAPAGVLASAAATSSVAASAKPVPDDLEDDPNVLERLPTDALLREASASLLWKEPVIRIETSGPVRSPVGERRAPTVMPAGVEIALPTRTVPTVTPLDGLFGAAKAPIVLSWAKTVSSSALDHVDIRVENLTSKKTVFHKIYRRTLDITIATKTALPVDPSWFVPGAVNELQVRASAVDRLGRTSGIVCASLAMQVDAMSDYRAYPPGAGKCFTRGIDLGEGPLTVPPVANAIVIGKYLGTPFRPTSYYTTSTITIHNDTSTPRRLRSLFTPDYSEIPVGIDLAVRKDPTKPAGLAPIDTGIIGAFATVDVPLPAGTPEGYSFTLFDADNGPLFRLRVTSGTPSAPKYW